MGGESPGRVRDSDGAQVNDLKVSDALWDRMRPLLPVVQRRRRWPGRKRMDDRACLNGLLFVLATGIGWERLPQQLGYGSGMTCWRRLRDWQAAAYGTGCTRCCWLSCAPPAGSKHHILTRCNRHTADGHPDRRQPQRRHATDAAPGRGPTNPRSRRSPTPQAQHAGR